MEINKNLCLVFSLLISIHALGQSTFLSGKVTDSETGESLIGVNLMLDDSLGAVTDVTGNYTLPLKAGPHQLKASFIGYETYIMDLNIKAGQGYLHNISMTEATASLDVFVVSASRVEQKLEEVTVSMDVIRSNIMENKNNATFEDVMQYAPGVQLIDGQLNIRAGSGWSYGTGSRVLVMVDGMPLLSADQGEVQWGLIPMENIEQVEIIKGASSALYGSSALNGVVNIRTKMPTNQPGTNFSYFQGYWDTPRRDSLQWWGDQKQWRKGYMVSHSRKIGNLDLVASSSFLRDMGYKMDGYNTQARFGMNTRYRHKNLVFGLNGNHLYRKHGTVIIWEHDSLAYIPLDTNAIINEGERYYLDPYIILYANEYSKHTLRSRLLWRDTKYNSRLEENEYYNNSFLGYTEYQFQYNKEEDLILTAGLTNTYLEASASTYEGLLTAANYSFYTQLDKKVKRLRISAGGRYEYFILDTLKIGAPVFRGGLNYEITPTTFARASYGQGFRFPSMTEMFVFSNLGPVSVFPNPNLKPESGWSSEVGVKQSFSINNTWKGMIDLAGFWMQYNDMMEFTFGAWGPGPQLEYIIGFTSLNVGRTRITGAEITLTGEGRLGKWDLNTIAGFNHSNPISLDPDSVFAIDQYDKPSTYINTSSDTTGYQLKYRHRNTARFDLEIGYDKKVALGFGFRYNSKINNIDSILVTDWFNGSPLFPEYDLGVNKSRARLDKGYYICNARVRFTLLKTMSLSLIVENLFNKEYQLRPTSMGPPRSVIFQLRANIEERKRGRTKEARF